MLDEELFSQLSEEAQIVIRNICPNATFDEAIEILSDMAEFESPPPTIDEFLDLPYYLGHIGPEIFPFWREQLRIIHPSPYYSPFEIVVVSGSTGGGKSWCSIISLLYEICVFLHRRDAHEHFGVGNDGQIYVGMCNNTLTLSKDTQLKNFFNMFNKSPFFKDMQAQKAKLVKPTKGLLDLNLPYNINLLAGSTAQHFIGRAVMNVLVSELNAMTRQGGQQASNVISELEARLFTRFHRGTKLPRPGKIYLDSSKKETTGSLDSYIDSKRGKKNVHIIEAPFWKFTEGTDKDHNDKNQFFYVFKGSRTEDPRMLDLNDPDDQNVPESLVLKVPENLRPFFEMDVVNALRDLGGVATSSSGNFISSAEAIADSLCLPSRSKKEVIKLDLHDDSDKLIDYVDLADLDRNAVYYMHLDLSKNRDRTGICMLRVSGKKQLARFDRSEGLTKMLEENVYSADVLLALKAKPNQQVPIYKIEAFIYDLIHAGFKIGGVTFDQFGSLDVMQRLNAKQVPTEYLSVDRPRQAYDTLRQTLMERRIKIACHPPDDPTRASIIEKELRELIDLGDKINHPDETEHNKGEWVRPSKDLADALCGALWNCINLTTNHTVHAVALETYMDALEDLTLPTDPIMDDILRGGFSHIQQPGRGTW